jgi:hypothetical protein
VSNAAADEPVERMVRAAFSRWNVEHGIRLSKGESACGTSRGATTRRCCGT